MILSLLKFSKIKKTAPYPKVGAVVESEEN